MSKLTKTSEWILCVVLCWSVGGREKIVANEAESTFDVCSSSCISRIRIQQNATNSKYIIFLNLKTQKEWSKTKKKLHLFFCVLSILLLFDDKYIKEFNNDMICNIFNG